MKCERCGIETGEDWKKLCPKHYAEEMDRKEKSEQSSKTEDIIYENMKKSISDTLRLIDEFKEDFERLSPFDWGKICNAMFIARERGNK